MAGFGSPCGACKFLRRKCVAGCVFEPFFRHEQGAEHFAAIHKVFGASNAAKLLLHLPAADRSEAAVTISYEAQARLQDPIYGCVAHIFALQQQVVDLQAQVASLEAQAARGLGNGVYQNEGAASYDSAALQLPQRTPFPQLASSSSADVGGLIFSSYNFPPIDQFDSNFNTGGENDALLGIEKELFPATASYDSQDNLWKSTYQDMEGFANVDRVFMRV